MFCPSGHSLWMLDWTCYLRTPLCHVQMFYWDILQGSSRLCNWLSLRCLVLWINYLAQNGGPLFGNLVWNDSGFVSLTQWRTAFSLFLILFIYVFTYILMHNDLFFGNTPVLSFYKDVVFTLSNSISISRRAPGSLLLAAIFTGFGRG